MLGLCEAENGTKIDELLQAGASGTKEHEQMLNRIQVLEDGRVLAATNRKTKGQKKKNHEKRVSGFCTSLRWKVSWRKKDCGILRKTKLCQTEVP